jgi:hypothetical protein
MRSLKRHHPDPASRTASPAPARSSSRIRLDVAFADNARVKALGARWDPDQRCWWIAGERWRDELTAWLPRRPVPAIVLAITTSCWRCHTQTAAIVGVLIGAQLHPDRDPWGFIPFADIATALTALPADWRAARGVGTIKPRHSGAQQCHYTSNGCVACDALLGDFFNHEELVAQVSSGRSLAELAIGITQIPAGAVPDDDVSVSLGCDPPRDGELEQLYDRMR